MARRTYNPPAGQQLKRRGGSRTALPCGVRIASPLESNCKYASYRGFDSFRGGSAIGRDGYAAKGL
jgi:hypothetical protein